MEGYLNNKTAVELWAAGTSGDVILRRTGLKLRKASKLFQRCAKFNIATRSVNGFWPCIPGSRVGINRRSRMRDFDGEHAKAGRGLCGILGSTFRRYPSIATAVTAFVTKREVAPGMPASVLTLHKLHAVFLRACRAEKLDVLGLWPFNTRRMGYRAICQWYKQKRYERPIVASRNEEGDAQGQTTKKLYAAITHGRPRLPLLGYERVELDEHYLDGMFSIGVMDENRVLEIVTVRRLWALVLRDVSNGAILACTMAFGERYNRSDVLRLVHQAIHPPKRYKLTFDDPEYCYKLGAAFPAELLGFERNGWQELALDSDAVHQAPATWAAITAAVGCRISHERVGDALARACIEKFFDVLAEMASWLPSAVGNHPASPARRDPEAAARKYCILAALANQLLDVICRNYNATATGWADGRTPIHKLQERLLKNEVFRHEIGTVGTDKVWMLCPAYPARFNRRTSKGRLGPLYVELYGARYSSPQVANNPALARLADQSVTLYVQEDARFAYLVPNADPSLVFLVAITGKHAATPHNLSWRRALNAFIKNAGIADRARSPHTLLGFLTGLAAAARNGGVAATVLADATEFMTRYQTERTEYIGTTKEDMHRLLDSLTGLDLDDEEDVRTSPPPDGPMVGMENIPVLAAPKPPPKSGMIF